MKRYLPVDVYASQSRMFANVDTTNGGVTSTKLVNPGLVVPCPDGHVSQEQVDEHGFIVLVVGEAGGVKHFKPVTTRHTMFGGNFVYSSDSRFSRTYGRAPVKVHDRIEN